MSRRSTFLIVFVFVMAGWIAWDSFHNEATSYVSGAPAGRTGSPGDNFTTCTYCHSGPAATSQSGWITSNIGASGYVPGSIYTITATATRPGHVKFGFEISPQNPTGGYLGTLVVTN